ncbi:hypothetical protein F5B21DRAFT_502316 [Xylaria acuta]|nr:hypothetical protein F5B21DRAFT_502316 [Xylaria acuta]
MKFTTTTFSILAFSAGIFAAPRKGPFNVMPPFNAGLGFVPSKPASPNNTETGEGYGGAAAPANDTVTCNRFAPFPFPHGPPHFAPCCSPVSIPHGVASGTSNSCAALAVGITVVVFSL